MSILLTITIALLVTFIGSRIASHFEYPPILGQFGASLLLAIPTVKDSLFSTGSIEIIQTFSDLAVIFLMLITGLELNLKQVLSCKKHSILIACFGSIIPLMGGLILGRFIGLSWIASFILGTTLSITAEGTNVAILLQLKKLKTKVGTILVSAGMMDDFFGIIYLSVILILIQQGNLGSLLLFPVKIIIFAIVVGLATLILPKIIAYFEEKKIETAMFNVVILTALMLSILSEFAGLSSIIGAFIAGIILQKSFTLKKDEQHEEHELEVLLFGFIIPFFFLNIALNFDYHSIIENPSLSLMVFIVAVSGKMIGALIVKVFDHLNWNQLYIIGIGMNSRGVVELVLANLALTARLISYEMYSAIVLMAVITTFITPLLMKGVIKKYPKIMN